MQQLTTNQPTGRPADRGLAVARARRGATGSARRRVTALAGGAVVALALAIVGTPALASAAAPRTALKAVLTTTPTLANVGQTVIARLARSTVPAGDHVAKITLSWGDGSKPVTLASLSSKAAHAYQVAGAFTITARLTDAHGASSTAKVAEDVTLPGGSYAGVLNGTGDGVAFYVSTARTAIQDVTIGSLSLGCTPGRSLSPVDVSVSTVPLRTNGSFAATVTEHGVVDNGPATYQITFQGQFSTLSAGQATITGSVKETASYVDGTSYHCTSGAPIAWTATRDAVQTVTAALPPTGSYSGVIDDTGDTVGFYVSTARNAIEDLTVGSLALGCSPGTGVTPVDVSVDSVPISRTGSFATTTTEHGVLDGSPATYAITIEGNVHGFNSLGQARIAGSVLETLTSSSGGTARSCTSGPQLPWIATRDATQTVTTGAPAAGSYSGVIDGTGDGVSLYVSNTKTAIQDVTVGGLTLECASGGDVSAVDVSIDSVPLASTGSFRATTTEDAVYDGSAAVYAITFDGNAHGLDAQGAARLAGSLTETLTYSAAGTTQSCTSGPQLPWWVTRVAVQTVTTGPPPAGSYAGVIDGTGDPVGLTVPSGGSSLEDLTVGSLTLSCTPGAPDATPTDVTVATAPVTAGGAIDTTDVQAGTYEGSAATYTIVVVGNFHGLDNNGLARAAGSITETLTYTSGGTAFSCSSGAEPWTVTHS